jgi:hypothetical protein
LFRKKGPKNAGVETGDLSIVYVSKIFHKHFPARDYKNCSSAPARKALAWSIEKSSSKLDSKLDCGRDCAAVVPVGIQTTNRKDQKGDATGNVRSPCRRLEDHEDLL